MAKNIRESSAKSMLWRVAEYDLIFTIVGFFYVIFTFYSLDVETTAFDKMKEDNPNIVGSHAASKIQELLFAEWIFNSVSAAFVATNLCAAMALLVSLKTESNIVVALRTARVWFTINVFFILVILAFAVYMFTMDNYQGFKTTGYVVFRGLMVMCAWPFISELKEAADYSDI